MNLNALDLLLIEDNMSDAELPIRELKKHHFTNNLFYVKDGEEALEFIFATERYADSYRLSNPPKLILFDIQMPKVNGIEVLQKIKSAERTKDIPVIILASSKEDPDIKACYNLGANSYIVKPVNFVGFAQSIKNRGFYWLLLNQPPV